jgi:hypothetical protein
MMTTSQAQTTLRSKPHDHVAHALRRLAGLRERRDRLVTEYDRQISELQCEIERLVFSAFPAIGQEVDYGNGDPIEFFVGAHRVRLYSAGDDAVLVEIDRSHILETDVDLFAGEEIVEGAV